MNRYLLDSNILIDYLRGYLPSIKFLKRVLSEPGLTIAISAITELEIYAGKSLDSLVAKKKVDNLLNSLFILPIDSSILRKAGELLRHQGLDIPDAIISATAILKNYTVVTRNIGDFQKIKNLKVLSP